MEKSDQITTIDFLKRALRCRYGAGMPEGCEANGLCVKKVLVMLVLALAVWVCLLLGVRVQGMMCEGAYVLSFQQEGRCFSSAHLSGLEREGIDLTFTQPVYPEVSNGLRRVGADVFLTNENYAYIAGAYIRKGTFFSGEQVREGMFVAVLSEEAVRRLFGNQECVGKTFYLNGISYQIVGIMEEQDTMSPAVYIPYTTMEAVGAQQLETDQLWCRFSSLTDAAAIMEKAGCPMETLHILRMDSVKDIFWQRFDLTLIFTGVYVGQAFGKKYGGACVAAILIWKLAAAPWCAPSAQELWGGGWKDTIYSLLDFYLLINVKIEHMWLLKHWNLLSLLFMSLYLYLFSLHLIWDRFFGTGLI